MEPATLGQRMLSCGLADLSIEELMAAVVTDAVCDLEADGTADGGADSLERRLGVDEDSTSAMRSVLVGSGGLRRMGRMTLRELMGPLEPKAAMRLACALELGRRARQRALPTRRIVRGLADIEPHLRGLLADRLKEVFLVVLLDAKNRPIRTERVSEGCLTWSVVHPREVFAPAVRDGAGAILVAHNHPSGDPTPSTQDIEVTTRLVRSGEMLGIPLLDHVIVGVERSLSMRAQGYLDTAGTD